VTLALHAFPDGEALARPVADALGAGFGLVRTHRFPDGELLPTVPPPARTTIVYRSLDRPNEKLVELVLAAEAWRRLGARRLILVAPYLAYMRQDVAFAEGQAISQRAVARLLDRTFDQVVTVNAHLHRTSDLQDLFVHALAQDLSAGPPIADWLLAQGLGEAVVLGPDVESGPLVAEVAGALGTPWACFSKQRRGDRAVELTLQGGPPLRDRAVVLVDDICSSGATLAGAVRAARARGAADVQVVVVHALMAPGAEAALAEAGASRIVSTDTVPHPTNGIPLARLLAGALRQEAAQ